jgi:TRAP-type C4-dicarboxylate transport system substrate-binding protein
MTPFLYAAPFLVIMNLDTWNSLPADIQAAFEKDGEEFVSNHASKEADSAISSIQKIVDSGKKIHLLSAEEQAKWQEAVKPPSPKPLQTGRTKALRRFLQ